ncbi:MAG: hypothetical protein KA354_19570 [Phycisphaerae bacterium]|nr:hypothetical protein [Phycisphaerae bacterium]
MSEPRVADRLVAVCLAAACILGADALPEARAVWLIDVRKVWDQAPHNAFTDLIRFQGRWFLCFREGPIHGVPPLGTPGGKLRILRSDDGESWRSAALLDCGSDQDLRDPKLSITPDGRLMLIAAAAPEASPDDRQSLGWFSVDGTAWTGPIETVEHNLWLWRVTWHNDIAYGFAYGRQSNAFLRLYRSADGALYETVIESLLAGQDYPGETTIRFLADDTAYALIRRATGTKTGLLGTAQPPYANWTFKNLGVQLGGPNLIQLPDGRLVAGTRLYDGTTRTSLCWLDPQAGTLTEFLTLPSSGDTSYPGFAWHEGILWVSYYASHEGRASIYLGRVDFNRDPPPFVVRHLGCTDPQTEGFSVSVVGEPATLGGGNDAEDHWSIAAPTSSRHGYTVNLDPQVLAHPAGWTATARLRVVAAAAPSQVQLQVIDGRDVWALSFIDGRGDWARGVYSRTTAANGNDLLSEIDPTADYHTAQIVFDPAGDGGKGMASFYLDGQILGSLTRAEAPDNTSYRRILWGDNTSAGPPTESRWSYTRFETGRQAPKLCGAHFADADGDGDVDQSDFGMLQRCYTGPDGSEKAGTIACRCFDRDFHGLGDGDIDTDDLSAFMVCYRGPELPLSPDGDHRP